MRDIFTEEELERMIKFTAVTLYESMKEDSRFDIADIPEIEVKKVVKEWLSAMDDSDLQVQFVRACAMVVQDAIDQALKEDF